MDFYFISSLLIVYGFAIPFHEVAHGYVALQLGDDTAYRMGRLSLNPLRHIDPIGTILLPLLCLVFHSSFLFAYAKPVPVDIRHLHAPKRDMILITLAGPVSNIVLATLSLLLLHTIGLFPATLQNSLGQFLMHSAIINVNLAVFNMLPIPPLDGGQIVMELLPQEASSCLQSLTPYGFIIIYLLSISTGLFVLLESIAHSILTLLEKLTGLP